MHIPEAAATNDTILIVVASSSYLGSSGFAQQAAVRADRNTVATRTVARAFVAQLAVVTVAAVSELPVLHAHLARAHVRLSLQTYAKQSRGTFGEHMSWVHVGEWLRINECDVFVTLLLSVTSRETCVGKCLVRRARTEYFGIKVGLREADDTAGAFFSWYFYIS